MSQSRTRRPGVDHRASTEPSAGDDQGAGRQRVLVGQDRLRATASRRRSRAAANVASEPAASDGARRSRGSPSMPPRIAASQPRSDRRLRRAGAVSARGRRQRSLEQRRGASRPCRRPGAVAIVVAEREHRPALAVLASRPPSSHEPSTRAEVAERARSTGRRRRAGTRRLRHARCGRRPPSRARAGGAGRPAGPGRRRRCSSRGPGPGCDPIACCMIPIASVRASRCAPADRVERRRLRHGDRQRRRARSAAASCDRAPAATRANSAAVLGADLRPDHRRGCARRRAGRCAARSSSVAERAR